MIAFLLAYNVVVLAITLTFKIIVRLFRLFVVAPIQAMVGTAIFLCTWLIYSTIFVAGIYGALVLIPIAVAGYIAFKELNKRHFLHGSLGQGLSLHDSIHLWEFLEPHGPTRSKVKKWVEERSIRIRNKNNGQTFYPSSEVCRLWPGDIVLLRREGLETQIEVDNPNNHN